MAYGLPWQAYTFIAILFLLLSFVGAKVVLSSILRRRMAIRNGTYVPQSPPPIPACVDLSKKPELWEAYLVGGGGWRVGCFGKKELDIGTSWKSEYSTDWESIKPIYAGYPEPLTSVPCSDSTPNLTTGFSPLVSIPVPAPINHSVHRGVDEENQRTSTTTPSLLTRARRFFNPNSTTVLASSSTDNGTNSGSISGNIPTTEISSNSPSTIRVAVLIAMPSPPSSRGSSSSSTPLSPSLSSKSRPTTSHSLELSSPSPSSPSPSSTTLRIADSMEEQRFPHIEMGVADVVQVVGLARSENSSTWDSVHTRREESEKTTYSRGK